MTTTRYQDDLYQAVNGQWQETAVIPDDRPTTGGFADLDQGVEKQLMADFEAVAAGELTAPDHYFEMAVQLYQQAVDFETRDKAGIAPALKRLAPIVALSDLAHFNTVAADFDKLRLPLPFSASVSPDMKDTAHNVVGIAGPDLILPDTTYYAEDNEQGPTLMAKWREMAAEVLTKTDLSTDDQAQYLADTIAFDQEIAKHVKSSEEWADYPAAYNPQALAEVNAQLGEFDFEGFAKAVWPELPATIIVEDPRFLKEFTQLFNAERFTQFKHWAYVLELLSLTGYLSDELRILGGSYSRALSGSPAAASHEKHAYRIANANFSEPIGIYYGRKYFGEEAKKDVTKLVEEMIVTYKRRLSDSDWLSAPTKEKAIVKLDKMVLKMGYPDTVNEKYTRLSIDPAADFLTNVINLAIARHQWQSEQLVKPVDRTQWNMPGHLVNASYDPSRNDITFPAAILQAPFYSLKQSASQNLGGIGAVIAHEISHGFDNNGAQFDEYGNMVNWWQEADYAHFKDLTNAMIAQFDGLTTEAGTVNGKLVVSENIADAGGLAAALDTAKHLPEYDLDEFFINWARVWRQKARVQYQQLLLSVDVHAPAVLRANVQPQNLEEWYTTFDVKPEDKMYLAPEKRLTIW